MNPITALVFDDKKQHYLTTCDDIFFNKAKLVSELKSIKVYTLSSYDETGNKKKDIKNKYSTRILKRLMLKHVFKYKNGKRLSFDKILMFVGEKKDLIWIENMYHAYKQIEDAADHIIH